MKEKNETYPTTEKIVKINIHNELFKTIQGGEVYM